MENIGFIIIAILLLASAFFSGSEIAILSANKIKLRQLKENGSKRAKIVLQLLEEPANFFSFIQIGNTSFNIIIASLATLITINLLGKKYVDVAMLLVVLLVLIFGEIVPKGIAIRYADKLSLLVAPLVKLLMIIFYPLIFIISTFAGFLIKILGGKVSRVGPFVTEEELKMLVGMSEEEGVLEKDEKEMIQSIFEFKDTLVREVMVPRVDMVCVEVNTKLPEIINVILKEGHSRIPVYEENIDKVVGIAYAKDILRYAKNPDKINLKEIMRSVYFVPEAKKIDDLFRELRKQKNHIAVVVDEYGGVAGLITIEDLLEEIVGEIQDEYDAEEDLFKVIDENTAEMHGRLNIDELNEKFGTNIEPAEFDTVAGFILHHLGKIPQINETMKINGLEMVILEIDKQKISKVRITKQKDVT